MAYLPFYLKLRKNVTMAETVNSMYYIAIDFTNAYMVYRSKIYSASAEKGGITYMGKENDAMLEYLEDSGRFADVFNGCCFNGARVILADQLTEGSEIYVEKQPAIPDQDNLRKKKPHKATTATRTRDIKKRLLDGTNLRILAIENQNEVDFTMPWRHMNYDCLEYGKQLRTIKRKNQQANLLVSGAEKLCGLRQEDRLAPVFTLCIYHGTDTWNGPRCLKDMMNFGSNSDCWEQLFSDYGMQLLCINEITDFSRFQSPLRELFELLACRQDKKALREITLKNPAYQKMDKETAHVASVLMGVKPEKMSNAKNQEGSYNMCKGLQDLMLEERTEGRAEGLDILILLQKKLLEENRMEDMLKTIHDSSYRDRMLKEFGFLL